ncbi:stage II sporulation protein M [Candidatus Pacearchaeota archaeon]|nr:stage II sporulation protein M [Candidatus Pacearchaeota archaeon]
MQRKKKRYSIFKEYKETWNFLKKSKYYLLGSVLAFILFFIIGFFVPIPDIIMNMIKEWVSEVLKQTEGLGFFGMWFFIFKNNVSIAFLAIFLGLFLGLFPALSLIFNAYFVGAVTSMVVKETNISEIWRLVPHGLFELPAIFISFSIGIKMGTFIFYKNPWEKMKEYLKNGFKIFIYFIVPLLIIAAIIEAGLIVFLK